MVGSPPVPLRRWLAPVASLLRLQPPVRPTSPPGLPPLSRTEILARYRRLRQISKQQHEAVLDIIAADVLLDWAKRIDMTDGKAIVLENDMEKTLPQDLAIYLLARAAPTRSTATPGLHGSRPARTRPSCSRRCVGRASPCGASSGGTRPQV
jgi:hypothetical protein